MQGLEFSFRLPDKQFLQKAFPIFYVDRLSTLELELDRLLENDKVVVGFALQKCGDIRLDGGSSLDAKLLTSFNTVQLVFDDNHHILWTCEDALLREDRIDLLSRIGC